MFLGNFRPEGKVALLVGASQGVGADLAMKLYQRDCSVILVARTESKLKSQLERIEKTIGKKENAKLSYIVSDASLYEQTKQLWHEITVERNVDPDFIFCCAGSSIPKLFNDLSESDLASGISINYNTALNTVHAGFKQILALNSNKDPTTFKKRHIIFFSSVVSFFPFIGYGQYAPMKAALQSLSLILRQELGPYNYRVSCIFPGNFASEGFEEEQKSKPEITKKIEGSSYPIPSAECADLILKKLDRGYDTVTTDWIGWLLGCSVLGTLPRELGFLQIFVGFIFLIISPIANWVINRDIVKYFQTNSSNQDENEEFEIIDSQKKTN